MRMGVVLPVLINTGVFHHLHPEAQRIFGVYIALVAVGMIPFPATWHRAITASALALAVWLVAFIHSPSPGSTGWNPG